MGGGQLMAVPRAMRPRRRFHGVPIYSFVLYLYANQKATVPITH